MKGLSRSVGAMVATFVVIVPAQAQVRIPNADPRVRNALAVLKADNAWTLDQQQSICEIPAPPFKETKRGLEYKQRLEALGLRNVRIDSIGNVIAERPGVGNGPTVVIAGHLDTVFPEETDVRVKREGTRLSGPGIGDDCRGLAVVLAVARAFEKSKLQTRGTVYFIGNVGEEGPGNLRGVRHLFNSEMKGKIDYFISVDGTGLGVTQPGSRQQPLPGHVQGTGRSQLRRVRHSQSDSRAGPRHGWHCRPQGAGSTAHDLQRRHHRRRHIGELHRLRRRHGDRHALRVAAVAGRTRCAGACASSANHCRRRTRAGRAIVRRARSCQFRSTP